MGNLPLCRGRGVAGGFTLVELLIVILVMAVAAMAAAPAMGRALTDARLSAAAAEVVNALEFARLSAMTSGEKTSATVAVDWQSVYVYRSESMVSSFHGGGFGLPESVVESENWAPMPHPLLKGEDYVVNFATDEPFKGTRLVWSELDVHSPVFFDSLGAPSHGGSVVLVLGSRQCTVRLNALTGSVEVVN